MLNPLRTIFCILFSPPFSRISLSDLPQGLTSKYEIVDAIGKGAFGSVYKIRDKTTRRLYAAKVVDNIPSNKAEVKRNYKAKKS